MSEFSVENWPSSKIRETFINYFVQKKGHTFWKSSPVVPINDPTLLFINAGMNQFKPVFLGTIDPSLEMSKLKRAVNTQKCIRAGGKHNDLDDVGKDVYHHTFFEMLGNWSFGDYFKEEAIDFAWECLVNEFNIPSDRLYATYFGGDEAQGLAPDEEAKRIWLKYLPEDRILPFGCKDNFWEMGATGPCGPCTEIHFDRIGNRDAAHLVNADRPDVIEIWNNVFIQFNRENDGSLKDLPNKHIDTGMGFERLSSILQGKDSNYDTDIFMPIFDAIQKITGCRPYAGKLGDEDEGLVDTAYRVVADHIRTLTFAITDGAMPSSDGRGYVLRRILRRAVRYGQEILGAKVGFFAQLVPTVCENFSVAFPELKIQESHVLKVIQDEENSFSRTLDLGVKHLKKVIASLEAANAPKVIPAKDAHILFTSMGFPLDLTELMAEEKGYKVDKAGFEELMENDRKISESAHLLKKVGDSKDLSLHAEQTSYLLNNNVPLTNTDDKYIWNQNPTATVKAIYLGKNAEGHLIGSTELAGFASPEQTIDSSYGTVGLIFDKSSFYYESGGQIFDTGFIKHLEKELNAQVINTQIYAGYVVHTVQLLSGELKVGDVVELNVDYNRRSFIAPNHSTTHMLNYAIRHVLLYKNDKQLAIDTLSKTETVSTAGLCDQKGSYVDDEKLRFDFSWNQALTSNEIKDIQEIVNDIIKKSVPVSNEVISLDKALSIFSLRTIFGETYPDPVRVVSIGENVNTLVSKPEEKTWVDYSIEFCGGTHIKNTSEAEVFVLIEESGIAKGIRRIVGLTRDAARKAIAEAQSYHEEAEALLKLTGGDELLTRFKKLKQAVETSSISLVDKDSLRKKIASIYEIIRQYNKSNLLVKTNKAVEIVNQVIKGKEQDVFVIHVEFGADAKVAKKLQEIIVKENKNSTVFLFSVDDEGERVAGYALVSAEKVAQGWSSKLWIDSIVAAVGAGKGGGKADSGNVSIPLSDSVKLENIIESAVAYAKSKNVEPVVSIN